MTASRSCPRPRRGVFSRGAPARAALLAGFLCVACGGPAAAAAPAAPAAPANLPAPAASVPSRAPVLPGVTGPGTVTAQLLLSYERDGEGRALLEGELWARRPDRLKILTHFGLVTAFDLVAVTDSFWVAIPHAGVRLDGRKSEVQAVPLDPGRLSQALFLAAPAGRSGGDSVSPESTAVDSAGSWTEGSDSLGTYRIRMDTQDRPRLLERTRPGGDQPFLRIVFERYAQVDGGSYPRVIRWEDLEKKQSLSMEFTDVKLGAAIDEDRFQRPGAERRVIAWRSWEALLPTDH